MKKSDVLRWAMIAVMNYGEFSDADKLELLPTLFAERDLALLVEKEELKKQENNNG